MLASGRIVFVVGEPGRGQGQVPTSTYQYFQGKCEVVARYLQTRLLELRCFQMKEQCAGDNHHALDAEREGKACSDRVILP